MDDAGQDRSTGERLTVEADGIDGRILSNNAAVEDLVAQARALRALLGAIATRSMASASVARGLREERARLEGRLDEVFCELGARAFDLLEQGRVLDGGETKDPRAGVSTEEEAAHHDEAASGEEASVADEVQAPGGGGEFLSQSACVEREDAVRNDQAADREEEASPSGVVRVPSQLKRVRAGAPSRAATGAQLVAHLLPDIRDQLGEPPLTVRSYPQVVGELGKLKAATEDDRLRGWEELPHEVQVALGCFIAARYRHLQDETPAACRGVVVQDKDAVRVLHRLSNHFSVTRAGFVHGLARDHSPVHGARWSEDAAYYHRELARLAHDLYGEEVEEQSPAQNPERAIGQIKALIDKSPPVDRIRALVEDILSTPGGLSGDDPRLVRLMRPFRDHLSGAALSKLRQAIDTAEAEKDAEPDFVEELLPEDWPWHAVLSQSRVVMVGGDTRSEAKARIETIFRPGSFEWIPVKKGENMRQVQALAGRMQQGSVDIVILLTDFLSHKASDQLTDAAGKSEAVLVYCNRGYGVAQLREGIENFVRLERAG